MTARLAGVAKHHGGRLAVVSYLDEAYWQAVEEPAEPHQPTVWGPEPQSQRRPEMRNTKPTRYRTAGGNVVTYTPNPDLLSDPTNWGSWTCGGCHEERSGQTVAAYAESHAEKCKAL